MLVVSIAATTIKDKRIYISCALIYIFYHVFMHRVGSVLNLFDRFVN